MELIIYNYMENATITMNETKPKSIIIDGNLHNRFKLLCKGKSMKIGGVIEDLIRLYLENPKDVQKLIEENNEKHVHRVTGERY